MTNREKIKLIGNSTKFQEALRVTDLIAKLDVPVLVLGETGSGKESIARYLHEASKRNHLISVNCAAFFAETSESLLFSYANKLTPEQNGFVFQAHTGTLYLQEVTHLNLEAQAQLLYLIDNAQVLSTQQFKSFKKQKLDVRIVASSSENLRDLVAEGKFNADLYYRLCTIPVELPKLSEREDDVMLLADHFFKQLVKQHRRPAPEFSTPAIHKLKQYNWPGNIQELSNFCERMFLLFQNKNIEVTNLPAEIRHYTELSSKSIFTLPESGVELEVLEVDLMQQALRNSGGNKSQAARLLGLTRDTLLYRLKKYSINL
ncbi:hypothetical protein GCM10009133_38140 [Cocleimonas flava]|uniref:Regulatory Fis family protein n=1 Tax=Cocleimonas flava TaxID=634765 RepID=A0A4R1F712_9GAMM|nr:sigma 54-interacting transcriptional regulator [Cocleimonas flava]TCJ88349.1 regulatory Fis family protein [Cocleimonas flava]